MYHTLAILETPYQFVMAQIPSNYIKSLQIALTGDTTHSFSIMEHCIIFHDQQDWTISSFNNITGNWELGHISKNQVAMSTTNQFINVKPYIVLSFFFFLTLNNCPFTTEDNSGRSWSRWIIRASPETPPQNIFILGFWYRWSDCKKLIFGKNKSLRASTWS